MGMVGEQVAPTPGAVCQPRIWGRWPSLAFWGAPGPDPTLEGVLWCRRRARLDSGEQPEDQKPGRGSTGESDGSWVRARGTVGGMVRWYVRWRAR